jgi:multidrug resistance protein, MATE family
MPWRAALRSQDRIRTELLALWQLAWPVLVGQLANVGMAVSDVAMAGHASTHDLAGISLGVSIWNICIITLMGVMMSVAPTVSQMVGAQTLSQVPHVVRQALWKALGVGLLACAAACVGSLVFEVMPLEAPVRSVAQRFVWITSAALPAFTCYRALYGYSTSLNQTKPLMVIALAALALNVLVNWLLVFGHAGFPALGGVGCAWSTLVCVWFNLLALVLWMRVSPAYRSTWPLGRWEWPQRDTLRTLLHLGLPIGVTYFAETSAFSLIALLVSRLGATEVSAHQIALNFTSLVFMVPLSLGLALLTRVGHSLGAGDAQAARFRAWVGVGAAVVFAVVSASAMVLARYHIASAYTHDLQVAALAAQLLFWAAVFQISDATQVVASCAVRAYKVTRLPMALHLTAFWLVSLPLGYALGLHYGLGAQGFWMALVAGLTVAAIGLVWLLRYVARAHLAEAALPHTPPTSATHSA